MLISLKNYFCLTSFIILAFACQNNSLEILKTNESILKSEPVFESYLALEYLNFSQKLLSVADNKNSEYFAKKGLDTFFRKDIVPENPLNWQVDENQIKEMIFMQKRMEEINNIKSLRIQLPIQLAHLHYLYDCWISKESKGIFAGDEIANCRITFSKLIEEIESFHNELKKDKTPKTKIIEDKFDRFEVFFDAQNANLNDQSSKQLLAIIEHLKKIKGEYNLILVGNSDDNSNSLASQNLANARINCVKNYLLANGISQDLININYEGEDLPDIVTSDLEENKINRLVGVYVFYNSSNFTSYPLPLLQNLYLRDEISKSRLKRGIAN
jgi:outer membrane protein OmpA-like peptidoglycan-associated protein